MKKTKKYCVRKNVLKISIVFIEEEDANTVTYNGTKYPKNGEKYAFYNTERVANEHLDILIKEAYSRN